MSWRDDDTYAWDMDDDRFKCETHDCPRLVTHPDRYCDDCEHRRAQKQEEFDRLFEKAVRREHAKGAA